MNDAKAARAGPSEPRTISLEAAHLSAREKDALLLAVKESKIPLLSGSRDLLSLFDLNPLYDAFVRPYLPPHLAGLSTNGLERDSPVSNRISIKGKEKESAGLPSTTRSIGFSFGGVKIGGEVEVELQKPKKVKFEKSYTALVADIPGRNTIRRDKHIFHLVMNPDPQPIASIKAFDTQTLRDAFTLLPGQIPAFDGSIFLDGPGPDEPSRKKKKKRKTDSVDTSNGAQQDGTANGGNADDHRRKKRKGGDASF